MSKLYHKVARHALKRNLYHYVRVDTKGNVGCRVLTPWRDRASYQTLLRYIENNVVVMDEELWLQLKSRLNGAFHVVVSTKVQHTHPKGVEPDMWITPDEILDLYYLNETLVNKKVIILSGEVLNETLDCVHSIILYRSSGILASFDKLREYKLELAERITRSRSISHHMHLDKSIYSTEVRTRRKSLSFKRALKKYENSILLSLCSKTVTKL